MPEVGFLFQYVDIKVGVFAGKCSFVDINRIPLRFGSVEVYINVFRYTEIPITDFFDRARQINFLNIKIESECSVADAGAAFVNNDIVGTGCSISRWEFSLFFPVVHWSFSENM